MYAIAVKRYNPDQPRDPGGDGGGQWIPAGAVQALYEGQRTLTPVDEVESRHDILDDTLTTRKFNDPDSGYGLTVHATDKAFAFHDKHYQEHEDFIVGHMHDVETDYRKNLLLYQGSDYRDLNGWLRDGKEVDDDNFPRMMDRMREMKSAMDDGLAKAPVIPEGTEVYRTFRNEDMVNGADYLVGRTFKDPGFMSTTVDQNTAKRFYEYKQSSERHHAAVIVRMKTPKGLRGQYLGKPWSHAVPSEFELILPRNTQMKVTKVTKMTDGGIVMDAEIVG